MDDSKLDPFHAVDDDDNGEENATVGFGAASGFPGIMMSQDCVAWNEASIGNNPSDSGRGLPQRPSFAGKNPLNHSTTRRQYGQQGSEIDSIFSLLGTNGDKQRVVPPEKNPNNNTNHTETNSRRASNYGFPAPQNQSVHNRMRHSYPPSNNKGRNNSLNRKRPDSFGAPSNRHEKFPKRSASQPLPASDARPGCTISPLPPGQSPPNPQQKHASQQLSDFADLLNQMETPSPEGVTSDGLSNDKGSATSNDSGTNSTGNGNQAPSNLNAVVASQKALDIKPQALGSQAFLKAKQNKENIASKKQYLPNIAMDPMTKRPPLANSNATSSMFGKMTLLSERPFQKPVQSAPPNRMTMRPLLTAVAQPPRTKNNSQAPAGITAEESDDEVADEFGDFELSEEDFANVDILVAATQRMDPSVEKTVPLAPTKGTPPPSTLASATSVQVPSQPSSSAALHRQPAKGAPRTCAPVPPQQISSSNQQTREGIVTNVCTSEHTESSKSLASQTIIRQEPSKDASFEDDDPFGDFPDCDFDALENAAIATLTQQSAKAVPQQPAPVRNRRSETHDDETSFLSFTRYKVQRVETDSNAWKKTLVVKVWESSMLDDCVNERQALHKASSMGRTRPHEAQQGSKKQEASGTLVFQGSWFFVEISEGDVLHLCSLSGRFQTGPSALPIILHTDPPQGSDYDDLMPIVHPEILAIPTTVTETLDCNRRAVLKHRLGSSVSSCKNLLLGTMRHSLFEAAVQKNMTMEEVRSCIQKIIGSEAERLVGSKMKSTEANKELLKFWPQVQAFKRQYFTTHENSLQLTTLNGMGSQPETEFAVAAVKGVEEELTSHELGLKGNVDVLIEAITSPIACGGHDKSISKSLMSIELKTHHKAHPKPPHFAQLAYYTAMLLSRHGHTPSEVMAKNPEALDPVAASMLLYINNDTVNAIHVAPSLSDIKSLIQQRNTFSAHARQASRPRGVQLCYETDDSDPRIVLSKEAPPPVLPALESQGQCSRCFSARECMLYTAAESNGQSPVAIAKDGASKTHSEVIHQYTGHLSPQELDYFRTWDRLIDLEADATQKSVAEAWLEKSETRERRTSRCISSLVYQQQTSPTSPGKDSSVAFAVFRRSKSASLRTPLSSLQLQKGSYVTCGTDATTLEVAPAKRSIRRPSATTNRSPFRHQMKVFRGIVERIEGNDEIVLRTSQDSIGRLNDLLAAYLSSSQDMQELQFRLDADENYSHMGTLRRNLVDLLTKDREKPERGDPDLRRVLMAKRFSRLRELVIRLAPPVYIPSQGENMFNPPANARQVPGCDPIDLAMGFSELNGDQRSAVQKVASMQDYTLIQGYPGSGKSSTIVFIARMLAAQGKRVLITSYTHSAVDTCLLKLMAQNVAERLDQGRPPSMVRIGETSSVHPGVQSLLVSTLAAELETAANPRRSADEGSPSAEALWRVMNEARIVGATALKVPKSHLLIDQHFDVVIVDEAGQISQPVLLGALAVADTFVLVGDHMQLPPLVSSEAALQGGFGESMLARLAKAHPKVIAQLTLQYRMHSEICALASQAIYEGSLRCAINVPRLDLPGYPRKLLTLGIASPWLKTLLNPYRPLLFANTDGIAGNTQTDGIHTLERTATRQSGGNMVNDTEAALVNHIILGLVACGTNPSSIGVICPFNAQIRMLKECPQVLKLQGEGLEINTIDKYQGRDKEAIIVSFVRSNNKGKVGRLLEDKRRVNVAITRAKRKMILLGSYSTLRRGSPTLKCILDQIQRRGSVVNLPRGCLRVSKTA